MAIPNQALFEAPASHETHYSNPYSNPEWESEWEAPEAMPYSNPYSNPEMESEWENPEATSYRNPYSNPEWESEWENPEAMPYSNPYSNPEMESEWENPEAMPYSNPYSNPEFEDEGEYFFKKAFSVLGKGLKAAAKVARAAAPLAKKLAPKLAGTLLSLVPGGAIVAPLASKLTSTLLKEGEMEAMQMEAEFFGTNEANAEVGNTEVAHEAALTEFLAAQAAEASTEAEAQAAIATASSITQNLMGGRSALRHVTPTMVQATARLTQMMRKQGPLGVQLLRAVPTIQRQAIATLKAAARSGQTINSSTAIRAMAAATHQVLGNPQRVQKTLVRNAVLRQRTAPPNPRRATAEVGMNGRCPTCASRVAPRMVR